MQMPKVNPETLEELTKDFSDDWKRVVSIVVKKNGQIRATKPKVDENDPVTGIAAYIWRMVAFAVSPKPQHQCMPMTADFDLPAYDGSGKWSAAIAHEMMKELKPLEDAIVNAVPKAQWHGVHRWKQAFYG